MSEECQKNLNMEEGEEDQYVKFTCKEMKTVALAFFTDDKCTKRDDERKEDTMLTAGKCEDAPKRSFLFDYEGLCQGGKTTPCKDLKPEECKERVDCKGKKKKCMDQKCKKLKKEADCLVAETQGRCKRSYKKGKKGAPDKFKKCGNKK